MCNQIVVATLLYPGVITIGYAVITGAESTHTALRYTIKSL
jgi:hypothetical protein